jgi:HEAT repeat protein
MPSTTSRELAAFLGTLAGGEEPAATELATLSDLDRAEAEQVRDAWPAVPERVRVAVLTRAIELAEDNVDLTFAELGKIALDDPSPLVRAKAAEALWESGDRRTAERLRRVLAEDADESVRQAAAASLRQFVVLRELDQFDQPEGDAVVAALRAAIEDPAEPVATRAVALESLGARLLPWVSALIADAYIGDDRRTRLAAVHAMGNSADERWLDYLHEQFYSDDPEMRFEAVVAAGGVASEESIDALMPLLDDDDSQVAIAAVEALGEIAVGRAVEALKAFAERAPEGMQEAVATAIETALELGVASAEGADHDDDAE